jgi:peptidoglycan/LPS O-acetylase OafA/YrhL
MSHLAQLSALVGFLLPFLVAIVQKSHWSRTVRTVIGVAASVATATIVAILHGDVTLHTWGTAVIGVLGAAMVSYKAIWEPIGAAPWLERVTTGQGK